MFASSRSRPPSAAESARSSAAGTTRKPLATAVQANALDKVYAKPWVHTHKHKRTRTSTCTCTRTHQSLKVIGATVILCVVLIDSKQLLVRDIDCYRGVFCVCVLCMRVLCMHTSAHSKRQRCSKTCRCVPWEQKKWGGE